MSLVWASRWFGTQLPERCNLTELFRLFLQTPDMPPSRAALVGCSQRDVAAAAEAINGVDTHCKVVAETDGFRSLEWYEEWFRGLTGRVDMVLVGMGSPRSEEVLTLAQRCLDASVFWHIGGGTILFLAGTDVEAPAWMRRSGLQWVHRLLHNPNMWSRYLFGNIRFVALIVRAAIARQRRPATGRTDRDVGSSEKEP